MEQLIGFNEFNHWKQSAQWCLYKSADIFSFFWSVSFRIRIEYGD